MLKPILAASIILGSMSFASAMPVAPVATGASLQVVKTAIVVVRRPIRRAVIVRRAPRRVIIRR